MDEIGNRLRIRAPSGNDYLFYDSIGPGGVSEIDAWLDSTYRRENPLASAFLLATPRIRSPEGEPVVLVSGWSFASDQPTFRVIGLDSGGVPSDLIRLEHFGPVDIQDLDGDGQAELIGYEWMSEMFGRCYQTYNPKFVLAFSTTIPFRGRVDTLMSARYNQEHGDGWAGASFSDEMVYVHCAPGGKRLMKVSDADTLTIPGH